MADAYAETPTIQSHFEYQIAIDQREFPSQVKQNAFYLMNQLQGWCSYEKAAVLIDIILRLKPEIVVEVGVYGGKSLVPMAYALEINNKGHIYGIDPWETSESIKGINNASSEYFWGTYVNHIAVFQSLRTSIGQFNLNHRISLIKSSSENASPVENIDILHIDGNHSAEASYLDVTKWAPLVKTGGVIILDDLTWFEENAYTQAKSIEWLDTHCTKIAEFKESNVWGIWRKQ
jgi:predicted O-methyltransferase YrrM